MAEHRGDENRGFMLRMSVRYREMNSGDEHKKTILQLFRSEDGRDTEVSLPESGDVVDTGWVPEIVYRQDELEIVVRPSAELVRCGHGNGTDKCQGKQDAGGEREGGATGEVVSAGASDRAVVVREAVQPIEKCTPPADEIDQSGIGAANPHQNRDDILYHVTFINREVRINGFRLSKPNFNSENEVVFDYLCYVARPLA